MYFLSSSKHINQLTNKRRRSNRELGLIERTVNSTYSNLTCHLLPVKLIYISHYFQSIWYINYSTRKITLSKWGKTGVVYEKISVPRTHSINNWTPVTQEKEPNTSHRIRVLSGPSPSYRKSSPICPSNKIQGSLGGNKVQLGSVLQAVTWPTHDDPMLYNTIYLCKWH